MAIRISAQGGALDGFELIFAITGVGDVVLGMSLDDVSNLDATTDAFDKAAKVLGTPKAGA
jgi:hypothetical protein